MSRGKGDYILSDRSVEVIDVGTPPPHVPVRPSSLPKIIAVVSGVLALLYLCSPIDLIPEAVLPLVGFVDDLLVFAGGLAVVGLLLLAIRAQERKRQDVLHQQQHTLRQMDLHLEALAAQLQHTSSRGEVPALPSPSRLNTDAVSDPRDLA